MKRIFYFLVLASFVFFSKSTIAQTKIYIRALDSSGAILNGGSVVQGHQKDIEALAYSHGVSKCANCDPSLQDYSLIMNLNAASITARQLLLKNSNLTKVDVAYRRSGDSYDYYNIHMEDVAITSISESGSSEVPTISLTFLPKKIAWQYTMENSPGGSLTKTKGGWDFQLKKEFVFYK